MNAIVVRVRDLLSGEPLRAITYGAIIVVWVVTHAAFALGVTHQPGPGFDVILAAVSAALALLNEVIRLYVASPNTLAAEQAAAAGLEAALNASGAPTAPADVAPADAPSVVDPTSTEPTAPGPGPAPEPAPAPDPSLG
jgi:hypothetical protein